MPRLISTIQNNLPTPIANGSGTRIRASKFSELITNGFNPYFGGVENGNIYSITNPTIGTGITSTTITSFSATNALFHIQNRGSSEQQKRIYPISFKICVVTPATNSTSMQVAITTDNITRYSSGGSIIAGSTATGVPRPTNMASDEISSAFIASGAVTLVAAGRDARQNARFNLSATIPIIREMYSVFWEPRNVSADLSGAGIAKRPISICPPISLGYQHCMNVHVWYPGATVPFSHEFEFTWLEQ